jgi:EpsD family peptidyl-prolyl cis-trans isomerase
MRDRAFLVVSLIVLAAAPAGCGRSERASASSPLLAARVNGAEITLQQLPAIQPAAAGAPIRGGKALQALDKVIDRELLVQKALEAKLDRDPKVVQAIESARRQLLAQAWLERAAAAVRSTPDEVRAFYGENPALFAERRIYKLRELPVTAAADKLELIRSEAVTAKDLDELAGWLRWRSLKVGAVTGSTQAAEQLPLGYLPQVARMKDGEIAVFATPSGAAIVQLVHAQEAALSEREAAPLIGEFLAGRKRLELAATEVKRLREVASIEYVGDFKR